MAFQVGKYQDSKLLDAYATGTQLKQKDRELDQNATSLEIDRAYKEGLITNQERQILLGENELAHKKDVYDTTGKAYAESQTNLNKSTVDVNTYNIDTAKKANLMDLLKSDATSLLNKQFELPDNISAKDLISYDEGTGQFSFNEGFTADKFGVSQNANDMRNQLIADLVKTNPNLTESEINKVVNDNWGSIYGENMNSSYHDMNQYLSQAWQDEHAQYADANNDGTISAEESKALNDKLSQFLGTNPELRNILAPGMQAGGMDPANLMYNIGGRNVAIGGDADNYQRIQDNMKGFTWEMNINDNTGQMTWKKVPIQALNSSGARLGKNDKVPENTTISSTMTYSQKASKNTIPVNTQNQRHIDENGEEFTSSTNEEWGTAGGSWSGLSGITFTSDGAGGYSWSVENRMWGLGWIPWLGDVGAPDWGGQVHFTPGSGTPYILQTGDFGGNTKIYLDDTWKSYGYDSRAEYLDSKFSAWQ